MDYITPTTKRGQTLRNVLYINTFIVYKEKSLIE